MLCVASWQQNIARALGAWTSVPSRLVTNDFLPKVGGIQLSDAHLRHSGTLFAPAVYAGDNMDRISDMELVIGARKGDAGAFSALVDRYRVPALRFAYGIAGDEAEDAVQDAFVKAFGKLEGFRADAAFRPWLFTIVANEARNRRRAMSRRSKLELRVRGRAETPDAGADDLAVARDERRRLLDAVAALPDLHREVLALRFFAGLTENETAQVLSCPLGTAKSRLSRALDLLRGALDEEVSL